MVLINKLGASLFILVIAIILFITFRFFSPDLYFLLFDFYIIYTLTILIVVCVLLFINKHEIRTLCVFSLLISFFLFLTSIDLLFSFDFFDDRFQLTNVYKIKTFNMEYRIAVDGISIWFILLTTFLIPFVIVYNYGIILNFFKEYLILLFVLEWLMLNVFFVTNFFWFFVFFEAVLIPMFVIIGIWGSRRRKIHAGYQFLFYTIIGSVFMFISLFLLYSLVGVLDFEILQLIYIRSEYQILIFFFLFIAFSVKIPIIPVHIWLPEAHVEAPTVGSVILAGILLKLGGYGMVRLLLLVFSDALHFYTPFIYSLCLISVLYGACTTIRQIDLKKVIAYSSVVHMNFGLLGLFTLNLHGIEGSLFSMLSHGLVSSALFLSVGSLYDRFHTRNIKYFGGLVVYMPLFSFIFFFYTLANMGLPGTCSFVGEFLILVGVLQENFLVAFFGGVGLILSAVYVIWLFNRVVFGPVSIYISSYKDISKREFYLNLPFLFFIFFFGIFPYYFFNSLELSILNIYNFKNLI